MDYEVNSPELCGNCIHRSMNTNPAAELPNQSGDTSFWVVPSYICLLMRRVLGCLNAITTNTLIIEAERILAENPNCPNREKFKSFLDAY